MSKPTPPAPPTGPADTNDPNVRVSSTSPDKVAAAESGAPTASASVEVPPAPVLTDPHAPKRGDRVEKYEVIAPNKQRLIVERDIDFGTTTIRDADTGDEWTADGHRDEAPRNTV